MARNLARGTHRYRLILSATCAALLGAAAGCGSGKTDLPTASVPDSSAGGQSAETPAEKQTAAKSSRSDAEAASLLADVVAAYRQAKSYQDAGDLRLELTTPDGQKQTSPAFPFSVAFERPNKIRIHALEAAVLADGEKLYASVNSLQGQVLVHPDPDPLTLAAIANSDEMLTQAMQGQLGVDMPQLELLLGSDPIAALAGNGTPKLLADQEFLGQTLRRVAIEGPEGSSVFWIDPQTRLLVKYEFPAAAFAKEYSLADAKITADFKGAEIDAPIDAEAFAFELPEGARLLSRFLPPPPEAPSPLLGKKPAEFSFVDFRGGEMTQQSLEGKIVVLDFWATWCGWCFEGFPNLQKVYDEFEGNDQVVIVAVNTDEVTVTDEQVKQSFAKANLTIPVVRDARHAAGDVFQVQGLPTMVVLSADGNVEDVHIGYDPQLATTLPIKLRQLLEGKSVAAEELEKYQQRLEEYRKAEAEAAVADAGDNAN